MLGALLREELLCRRACSFLRAETLLSPALSEKTWMLKKDIAKYLVWNEVFVNELCILICRGSYLLLLSIVSVHAQLAHTCISVIPLFTWLYAVGLVKPSTQGIAGHFSCFQRFTGTGFCLLCFLRSKMVLFILTARNVGVCYFRKQVVVYCHFPSHIPFVHLFHSFTFFTSQFFITLLNVEYQFGVADFSLEFMIWRFFNFCQFWAKHVGKDMSHVTERATQEPCITW